VSRTGIALASSEATIGRCTVPTASAEEKSLSGCSTTTNAAVRELGARWSALHRPWCRLTLSTVTHVNNTDGKCRHLVTGALSRMCRVELELKVPAQRRPSRLLERLPLFSPKNTVDQKECVGEETKSYDSMFDKDWLERRAGPADSTAFGADSPWSRSSSATRAPDGGRTNLCQQN
jgi:hypothetical protein